jgi:hypothetical protein
MTTLLLLECGRDTPFEFALYAVAAAKFASERCGGVGQKTTRMFVTRKRREGDDPAKTPGDFVPDEKIATLREMWEKYSKPQIPEDALLKLHRMSRELGYGGGIEVFIRFMQMLNKEEEKQKPAGQ